MRLVGRIVTMLLLLLFSGVCVAQQGEVVLRLQGGDNAAFGGFGVAQLQGSYSLERHFKACAGVGYNTIGRTAVEARPAYFHNLNFGSLRAELMLHYVRQGAVNNGALGVGVGFECPYVWATIGYYHRQMWAEGSQVAEPFNIYYELGINCLPKLERWDLRVVFSNSRLLELERHYQPSLYVDGWWYATTHIGVMVGIGYKPAGMFNITTDYYQLNGQVGLCYRW